MPTICPAGVQSTFTINYDEFLRDEILIYPQSKVRLPLSTKPTDYPISHLSNMDENVNRFGAFDMGKLKIVVESTSLIFVVVTGK